MSRDQVRRDLIAFLETIRRPDVPAGMFETTDALVDAGLIDSLAILQIVTYLETEHGIEFAQTGLDPGRLRSISSIVALIEDSRT